MTPELRTRLLTAASLIIPFLLIILFASMSTTGLAVLMGLGGGIVGLGSFEFARLIAREGGTERIRPGLCIQLIGIVSITAVAIVLVRLNGGSTSSLPMLGVLAICGALILQERFDQQKLLDALVVAVPMTALLLFGFDALISILVHPRAPWTLFWLVGVVALTDTGAYFAGRAFGQAKLAPLASPNKTIAGAGGGILLALLFGFAGAGLLELPLAHSALLAVGTSVAAEIGDLLKSIVKRSQDVKDFGAIFPGHGGILDRFDGLLAGAPVLACYLFS